MDTDGPAERLVTALSLAGIEAYVVSEGEADATLARYAREARRRAALQRGGRSEVEGAATYRPAP